MWAVKCIEAGSVGKIIDPYLKGKISPLCLSIFVEIARKCVLMSGSEWPPMADVVCNLELALERQETAEPMHEGLIEATDYSSESFSSEWPPYSISYSSSSLQDMELSGPR
ncbi:receptor-like protein kinase FERONIA [Cornus florida]|uniref:receptor-like protein kinase FERONIA n=1 Tax=Cornus florida TaxID=4283 RepID=UPI00289D81CA|nr:receptor-like protein kinase FERONIA [Cornus florida]